ncbi:cupin domain-containing protein [Pseudoalteromonas aurantia]|nr:cupin domain-containing protein [Pseudoalteromonas aurantia]
MMKIVNVLEVLSSKNEGVFIPMLPFNASSFSTCDITGESPVWEMHPDTDEFFYIIDGEFEMTVLREGVSSTYVAHSGDAFVVPKGVWHKPSANKGCKFIYHTPGQSVHSEYPEE